VIVCILLVVFGVTLWFCGLKAWLIFGCEDCLLICMLFIFVVITVDCLV